MRTEEGCRFKENHGKTDCGKATRGETLCPSSGVSFLKYQFPFMSSNPLFVLGNVFQTPENAQLRALEYVITRDPEETLKEKQGIILSRIRRYHPENPEPWQVLYMENERPKMIDCMSSLRLTEEQLEKCLYLRALPPELFNQVLDAHYWAERIQKYKGL